MPTVPTTDLPDTNSSNKAGALIRVLASDETLDDAVNLHHLELVLHLCNEDAMWNLAGRRPYPSTMHMLLQSGLKSSYLMSALLAFSAHHLAHLHPERALTYRHLAVVLQTRAITLFNASTAMTKIDEDNCVAVLGFSAALGHHQLADILTARAASLDEYLTRYSQCLEMTRGIYTIARAAWPLLLESELNSALVQSQDFTSREPTGDHCDKIRHLIDSAHGLLDADRTAYRLAIRYLQLGFDAIFSTKEEDRYRYQILFSWSMMVPSEFTSLLAALKPEALIIMAHYASLLHLGRRNWQVGDSGSYILGMITGYLGLEWQQWLAYPQALVAEDEAQAR
ncbi:hypothetical protein LTR42_005471 [Elasticomyces elasticus]|nr:hypothetical protein LTR42_005471 [Elasticomyces elasticus]